MCCRSFCLRANVKFLGFSHLVVVLHMKIWNMLKLTRRTVKTSEVQITNTCVTDVGQGQAEASFFLLRKRLIDQLAGSKSGADRLPSHDDACALTGTDVIRCVLGLWITAELNTRREGGGNNDIGKHIYTECQGGLPFLAEPFNHSAAPLPPPRPRTAAVPHPPSIK